MDVLQAIKERKSFRRFKEDPISWDLVQHILEAARLAPSWHNKQGWDGSVTATLDNFDLIVNEKDKVSAKKALAEELVEYANEYFKDFQLYYNSLNRQPHFPYVLKVLLQNDINGVVSLIDA